MQTINITLVNADKKYLKKFRDIVHSSEIMSQHWCLPQPALENSSHEKNISIRQCDFQYVQFIKWFDENEIFFSWEEEYFNSTMWFSVCPVYKVIWRKWNEHDCSWSLNIVFRFSLWKINIGTGWIKDPHCLRLICNTFEFTFWVAIACSWNAAVLINV